MNVPHAPAQFNTRKTNVAEVRALIEAGLMDQQDPYELIDGVLYEMPSEGFDHGDLKNVLAAWLYQKLDLQTYRIFVDTTLYLDEQNAPEPDLYVFPAGTHMRDLSPGDVALVIEVANSSLKKDRDLKPPLYARFGIQEYWIVDIEAQDILVFRPGAEGSYGEPVRYPADRTVLCQSIPGLSLRLADLRA